MMLSTPENDDEDDPDSSARVLSSSGSTGTEIRAGYVVLSQGFPALNDIPALSGLNL